MTKSPFTHAHSQRLHNEDHVIIQLLLPFPIPLFSYKLNKRHFTSTNIISCT